MQSGPPIVTDVLPDIGRPDAPLVLVGEWTVPAGEQQRTVDAVADQWSRTGWPDGLVSHTVFAGGDHRTVLHYSQATSEDGLRAFAHAKPGWAAGVDATVAGITRRGVTAYRLHRSVIASESGRSPGCVVVVQFHTDGTERAGDWVDRLVDTGNREAAPPGLLSAHFHVALDGTRILNYAEWTDPAAHQATLGHRPADNDVVQIVDDTPGVRFLGFHRFTRWHTAADIPTH